jgi:hypothetical protein
LIALLIRTIVVSPESGELSRTMRGVRQLNRVIADALALLI